MTEYAVEDVFHFPRLGGWVACVRTTMSDADNFPINEGDELESGHKVMKIDLFTTWSDRQTHRSVGLLLDRPIQIKDTIKKKEPDGNFRSA